MLRELRGIGAGVLLVGATGLALACAAEPEPPSARVPAPGQSTAPTPAGTPSSRAEAGRRLFSRAGCAGCHTLRDVPSATGVVGPNLTNVVLRPTLAGGAVPTTPENLTRFLLDPPSVKPGTAMPSVGLTPEEAEAIAAFLYDLAHGQRR